MGLSTGIVGLPNVGKSTIFNALTSANALAANYPFATIEPNKGVVLVPDPRLEEIARYIKTERLVPATIEVVDIAGLVKGASQGQGLGNQFLGHIRNVDAILHIVRCFDNPDVVHVEGSVDPVRDVETIELELVLADLESAERQLEKNKRAATQRDPDAIQRVAVLEPIVALLREGKPARKALENMDEAGRKLARTLGFITAKPVLYVANVDDTDPSGTRNPFVAALRAWAEQHGEQMIIISGAIEAEIAALDDPEERRAFLASLGLEESGLARLARATYRLLGLHSFFTAGPKEVRAWTIPIGTRAPQAAGVIHSDFERGFIRAEVYTLDDLRAYKTEAAIRAAGKLRSEGKDYVVRDGDIMHFLFSV
ncbi:MAG: redox-regulated ATPase YchF [Thermoflexales bacterium]|nr:redox-regulated ATPase YchF [Thermoflexales bacterium]MCS7323876.1 redox-regulated ATPase YchF [Thermoflexales bacterium]MDW8052990.1 redox-regulated ATPase YchF [Anaerolineae bacterium]MDW8291643.1 redox-regulated ATPase YchF [Anaerolineae bacterium]